MSDSPSFDELKRIIESVLFVADRPVDLASLARIASVDPRWAGEAIDVITEKHSAAALVGRIAREAEQAIATAGGRDE